MSFAWTRLYHVGIVVPDLEEAMTELHDSLGVTWPEPRSRRRSFRAGTRRFTTELRFVYSYQGPPHLEIIEGRPGTPWDPDTAGPIHHVGVWVDDLARAAHRLVAAGAPIEVTYDTDDLESFTYHVTASGLRVELVDATRRPGVEAWLTAPTSA